MTEKEQLEEDLQCLNKLLEYSKDHIANASLEVNLALPVDPIQQAFIDINKYTKFYIPNSHSGNNKLYNLYVRKFLTKRAQQIFNSPKVIIYAQVPFKLQGVMYSFSPSKYKKAVKSLFSRVTPSNTNN